MHVNESRMGLPVYRGASSGASWLLGSCTRQALDGGQGVGWSKVRVPNRHSDILVTQEFLNRPQVNSRHDETADKRVSKAMPREVPHFCDAQVNFPLRPDLSQPITIGPGQLALVASMHGSK